MATELSRADSTIVARWDRFLVFPLFVLAGIGSLPAWFQWGYAFGDARPTGEEPTLPVSVYATHTALPALVMCLFLSLAAYRFARNMFGLGLVTALTAICACLLSYFFWRDMNRITVVYAALLGSCLGAALAQLGIGRFVGKNLDRWVLFPLHLLNVFLLSYCFWVIGMIVVVSVIGGDTENKSIIHHLFASWTGWLCMIVPPTLTLSLGVSATTLRFAPKLYWLLTSAATIIVCLGCELSQADAIHRSGAPHFVLIEQVAGAVALSALVLWFVWRYLRRFLIPQPSIAISR